MTYEELVDFINDTMTMSHIYQPLLIRSLVDAGGAATLRQLAACFLSQDESQLAYYEKRIKEMPVRVLAKHGVVRREGELVSLTTAGLSLEQRACLRMLCEQKMQEYVQKRGLGIWDYRMLEKDPIPDSSYYQAMKASGGRCALCGATNKERMLQVDHIIPRSRGGKNDLVNLQVLCAKCNAAKSNKDNTDFRDGPPQDSQPDCPFCNIEPSMIVEENNTVIAIYDQFPVSGGHLLVIPRRHTVDYFSMTANERTDAEGLLRVLRQRVQADHPEVTGFNVGTNCGVSAGQTIAHAHIHLIPRRDGDTPKPRGGVRGVIPKKMSY